MPRKKSKEPERDAAGLLTERQRSDLLGLALSALALFLGLSLVPPRDGGGGNLVGEVGAAFAGGGHAFLGAGVYLLPLIPALGALAAFGLRRGLALRWTLLATTLALLIPIAAGVMSAIGFLSAPLAFDFVRSAYSRLDELDWQFANSLLDEMAEEGRKVLEGSGLSRKDISYQRSGDMRYVGQSHELQVADIE